MAREHAIGLLSQIPPGEGRNFSVDGLMVAVFRTRADAVYATQAACPHRGGPLADGLTDLATVVCPLHDRVFDFRTGAGIGNDCVLLTYPVRVDADGTIMLTPEPGAGGETVTGEAEPASQRH
jgi:nitrite reductase (NADH) small subunit